MAPRIRPTSSGSPAASASATAPARSRSRERDERTRRPRSPCAAPPRSPPRERRSRHGGGGGPHPPPAGRAARRRTPGSSPTASSARSRNGGGSSRRVTGGVEVGARHRLGRGERATAGEHREAAEERLLVRRKGSRTTTRSSRAASAGAGRRRDRRRGGRAAARAARGSGPGRAPACARLPARPRAGASRGGAELGDLRRRLDLRPFGEEGDGLPLRSGGTGARPRPGRGAAPARHEQCEVRAGGEERRELRRRGDHLLEVVDEDQQLALADVLGEPVPRAECARDGLRDQSRIAERGKVDPVDACAVLGDEARRLPRARGGSCRSRRAPSA